MGQEAEFKFESNLKFKLLLVIWQSQQSPEGYSRRQSKILTAKSMAELLGQHSGTAWAGWTGKHKHRVYQSSRQLQLAVPCSLELPLLQY